MAAAFIYDCIRIFRRIIRHKKVWIIAVEDIIYWVCISFAAFSATYNMSDGAVRGFMIATAVLGAVLYRYVLGRYYVKYMTKWINILLKPLKKMFLLISMKIARFKQANAAQRQKHVDKKGGFKKWYLNRSMKDNRD